MSQKWDNRLSRGDHAACDFWLSVKAADPCWSSTTPRQFARYLDTSASIAGSLLADAWRNPPDGLDIERRPGSRGGHRYIVRHDHNG